MTAIKGYGNRMDLLGKLISESGFQDKILIGDALKTSLKVLFDIFKNSRYTRLKSETLVCKTLIIAKEKDYLFLGKTLRDGYIENGVMTEAFILEDETPTSLDFFGDYEIVVCVGDTDFFKKVCTLKKDFSCRVIFIPTSLVFADAFLQGSPLFGGNAKVFKCVIDIDLFKKLKRKDLADGYAFCASAVLGLFEYKINCAVDNKSFDEEKAAKVADNAYKTLLYITDNNAVGVITVAQLYLLNAFYRCPSFSDLSLFLCGKVLSVMTDSPQFECVFGLIGGLLVAIKAYYKFKDKSLFVFSDVNKDVERLSEILKVPQTNIYKTLKIYDAKTIDNKKAMLLKCNIEDEANKCLVQYKKLLKGYEAVYRGRHKRKNFSLEDERLAIKLGSVMSFGIMKLAYDDGFLSLICDLR